MHTSTILKEALNKLTYKFPDYFDLAVVLFSISVERLMKQHLYEIDTVLNNNIKHLVNFRELQIKSKVRYFSYGVLC